MEVVHRILEEYKKDIKESHKILDHYVNASRDQNISFYLHHCIARDDERTILVNCNLPSKEVEVFTREVYIDIITKLYGEEKLKRIVNRYNLSNRFFAKKKFPLTVNDVKLISLGAMDIDMRDVENLWNRVVLIKFQLKEDPLHQLDVNHLPVEIFNALMDILTLRKWDDNFTHRNRKLINGIPSEFLRCISYLPSFDDQERLQVYSELAECSDMIYYAELLAKIIAKKHLAKLEKEGKYDIWRFGLLLPAPKGIDQEAHRWYKLDDMLDSGLAKYIYRFVPATSQYSKNMSDILLYRSSATTPSSQDSFTSWLSDFNPFAPPGYFGKYYHVEKEIDWILHSSPTPLSNEQRPLLMVGHSLGGSGIQIALVNVIRKLNYFPDRKIDVQIFDSPAISQKDANYFAQAIATQSPERPISLTITYHLSHGDIVPFSGETHLGGKISINGVQVNMLLLRCISNKPNVLGNTNHLRYFYRGERGIDYELQCLQVEHFGKSGRGLLANRIVIEFMRKAVGLAIFPLAATLGYTKRFILGRRGYPSGIQWMSSHIVGYSKHLLTPQKKIT